jgi:hypothetical protein
MYFRQNQIHEQYLNNRETFVRQCLNFDENLDHVERAITEEKSKKTELKIQNLETVQKRITDNKHEKKDDYSISSSCINFTVSINNLFLI